jgi:hypothetical protein
MNLQFAFVQANIAGFTRPARDPAGHVATTVYGLGRSGGERCSDCLYVHGSPSRAVSGQYAVWRRRGERKFIMSTTCAVVRVGGADCSVRCGHARVTRELQEGSQRTMAGTCAFKDVRDVTRLAHSVWNWHCESSTSGQDSRTIF